jgi:hypothetical protein
MKYLDACMNRIGGLVLRSIIWILTLILLPCTTLMAAEDRQAADEPAVAEVIDHHQLAPVINDRWGFYLGGYVADFKTDAAIGSGAFLGAVIRAEDDLGLASDDSTFRSEAYFRINERHGLEFSLWSLSRKGSALLERPIEWDGFLFNLNARVDSTWDTALFRTAYKYSMVNNGRTAAGISVGLSTYSFDLTVEGEAIVCAQDGCDLTQLPEEPPEFVRSEEEVLAPVPTLGIFVEHAMHRRLHFLASVDFFDLTVSEFEGNLLDATFSLEWYFARHVGIGVGTNTTMIDVRKTGKDPYNVDYRQSGVVGYITFTFGKIPR